MPNIIPINLDATTLLALVFIMYSVEVLKPFITATTRGIWCRDDAAYTRLVVWGLGALCGFLFPTGGAAYNLVVGIGLAALADGAYARIIKTLKREVIDATSGGPTTMTPGMAP